MFCNWKAKDLGGFVFNLLGIHSALKISPPVVFVSIKQYQHHTLIFLILYFHKRKKKTLQDLKGAKILYEPLILG